MRVKVLKITQFSLRKNHAEDASYDASFVYSMICYYPSENKRLHFYLDSKVDGNYQVIMEGDYLDLELNEDGTVKSVTIDETSDFFLRF